MIKTNKSIKFFVSAIVLTLTLAGCAGTSDEGQVGGKKAALNVPANCEQQGVIDTFNASVEGSKYVPTDWQPSEGTDLAAAINAGGIACTYGIQVAEIGGTILWAPNTDNLWDERVKIWSTNNYDEIDIPGFDEESAYVLQDDVTGADGAQIWMINLLINNVWIQIGASFLQTIEEAAPFIQASIAALTA